MKTPVGGGKKKKKKNFLYFGSVLKAKKNRYWPNLIEKNVSGLFANYLQRYERFKISIKKFYRDGLP